MPFSGNGEVKKIKIKGSPEVISVFTQEIIDRGFGLDLYVALAGVTIYLGQDPYPPGTATVGNNKLRPHWNRQDKWIVLPPAYCYPGIMHTNIHHYLPHEIGHAIHDLHIETKPNRERLWQEWAGTFDYTLDFDLINNPTYRGADYWNIPTYEDFAMHFERSFRGVGISPNEQYKRLKWYANLWGQVLQMKIELPIGKPQMVVNGRVESIDIPAQIISGRTMVPLRVVSEALGAEVDWEPKDGKTEKVIITR